MHSLRLSPFVAKLRNGFFLFGSKPCFEEGFDRIQNDSVFSRMAKTTCAKSFARLAMEFASGPATVHLSVKLSAPLFFNAGLEYAMRKWKEKLKNHGFHIGAVEALTNINHANDIMTHAKSMQEFVDMLELLLSEFASIVLELNVSKTKNEKRMFEGTVFCRSGRWIHRFFSLWENIWPKFWRVIWLCDVATKCWIWSSPLCCLEENYEFIHTWTHFRICWKNVSPSNWKWISSILRPPPSRKCSYRNWTGATFDCWMGSHEEWTMSKSHVTSQFSTRLRADLAPCSEMVRSFFQSPIPGLKPTWHGPTVYRMCLG